MVAGRPSEQFFLQLQPSVIIDFRITPLYKDESFLRENYLEKGLNIAELAGLCFSSRCAVRNSLKRFNIPIKTQDQLLKTPQRLKYELKRVVVSGRRDR